MAKRKATTPPPTTEPSPASPHPAAHASETPELPPVPPNGAREDPVRGLVDRREFTNALPEGGPLPCEIKRREPDGSYVVSVEVAVRAKGVTPHRPPKT